MSLEELKLKITMMLENLQSVVSLAVKDNTKPCSEKIKLIDSARNNVLKELEKSLDESEHKSEIKKLNFMELVSLDDVSKLYILYKNEFNLESLKNISQLNHKDHLLCCSYGSSLEEFLQKYFFIDDAVNYDIPVTDDKYEDAFKYFAYRKIKEKILHWKKDDEFLNKFLSKREGVYTNEELESIKNNDDKFDEFIVKFNPKSQKQSEILKNKDQIFKSLKDKFEKYNSDNLEIKWTLEGYLKYYSRLSQDDEDETIDRLFNNFLDELNEYLNGLKSEKYLVSIDFTIKSLVLEYTEMKEKDSKTAYETFSHKIADLFKSSEYSNFNLPSLLKFLNMFREALKGIIWEGYYTFLDYCTKILNAYSQKLIEKDDLSTLFDNKAKKLDLRGSGNSNAFNLNYKLYDFLYKRFSGVN